MEIVSQTRPPQSRQPSPPSRQSSPPESAAAGNDNPPLAGHLPAEGDSGPPALSFPRRPFPRWVVALLGLYGLAGGLVTLTGWWAHLPRLTDWNQSGIAMFANTAVAAVCSGLAVLLRLSEARASRIASGIFGLVVAAIGGLTLFEHLSQINLGIDTLLIAQPWGERAVVSPGRMGPPASTSFTLLGVGLFLAAGRGRARRLIPTFGILVVTISLLGVIAYLFKADLLFATARLTGIAMQTTTIILALGLALLASVPEHEPLATLVSESAAGALARRVLPFVFLLPITLGWLFIEGRRAELFDRGMGAAMLVLTLCALLCALLWRSIADVARHEKTLRRAEMELQRRNKQLAAFLETAAIGLRRIGPDGIIEWANAAELQMLGYSPREYIGHPMAEFHADREVVDDMLRRLACGEKLYDREARLKCKDGSIKNVLIDSSALWENGRFIHAQCFTRDITDQKKAEEALRLSSRLPAENPAPVIRVSRGKILHFANPKAEEFLAEWNARIGDMAPPPILDLLGDAGRDDAEMDFRGRCYAVTVVPVLEGEFINLYFTDITARKSAEKVLEQRTRSLEVINRTGATLAAELDLEKLVQALTDAGREICGADLGAFLYNVKNERGESYMLYTLSGLPRETFSKFPMPRNTALFDPTFRGTGAIRVDDVLQDPRYGRSGPHHGIPQGHPPVRSYLAVPVVSRSGQVLGGLFFGHGRPGVFTEEAERIITAIAAQAAVAIDNAQLYRAAQLELAERKRVEAALRESEERFRATFENAAVGIAQIQLDGHWQQFNDAVCEITGYGRDELQGKTVADITHPEDIAREWEEARRLLAGEICRYALEKRYVRKDGSLVWVMLTVSLLRDSAGAPEKFISVIENIDARKRAQEGSARLAAIVEQSDDAIISKDLNGIIQSWNHGAERIFGYSAEEAIGRPITMLIPPHRLEEEPGILERIRSGQCIQHYETVRQRKDGTLLDISLTVSPIKDPAGKIIGASKVARDITDKVRAREILEQTVAERTASLRAALAQMEEFSYSVSHDLRAPLRAMSAYAGVLLEEYGQQLDETARGYLDKIQRSSERMNRLTQDLLAYSRVARSQAQPEPVVLERLIQDVIHQYTTLQPPAAEMEIVSPLLNVLGHETTLGQCVANLLNNAVKFVAPGVKPRVRIRTEQRAKLVRVWFEDNGIGIPPEHHERIFQMFERVHPHGQYEGTGIGLTIVRKAAEKMGGRAGVESDGINGSRFWIELRGAEALG